MRIRTSRKALSLACLLAAAAAGGACSSHGRAAPVRSEGPSSSLTGPGEWSLNRGDWLNSEQVGVWLVMEQQREGASKRIGYVVEKHYQEMRGGPIFTMYEVYNLDRRRPIGQVDSLGNAVRFVPIRNRGDESVRVGNAALELSVGAIFETVRPLTLERTTEHALAFEALDVNHDGKLDKSEFPRLNDKFHNPDKNKDGFVDAQEFDQADAL
jgi:Ca2+-binding EF-hand superfamily protein